MDNSFQTSFIPKKPIVSITDTRKSSNFSLFSTVATILLVMSIFVAGGLFAYKLYLTKQKTILSESILKARDSFEKETINELNLFDNRTKIGKDIISNHVALSSIFSVLGDITIPDVQYNMFDEQITDKGVLSVNINGLAKDYRSIAIQADMFNSQKASSFNNVLFSNLSKGKEGVSFNLKFNVDRSSSLYSRNFKDVDNNALKVGSSNIKTNNEPNNTVPSSVTQQ